jgi:phage baseplate assembly protein gpV
MLAKNIVKGYVLGAVYNKLDSTPYQSQDKAGVRFEDGTEMVYDREQNLLFEDIKGRKVTNVSGNVSTDIKGNINEYNGSNIETYTEGDVESCVCGKLNSTVNSEVKFQIKDTLLMIIDNGMEIETPMLTITGDTVTLNNGTVKIGNNACVPVVHAMTLCPIFGVPIGSAGPKPSNVLVPQGE